MTSISTAALLSFAVLASGGSSSVNAVDVRFEATADGSAISELKREAAVDPDIRDGLARYDALPAAERKEISDYLDSAQFSQDIAESTDGNFAAGRIVKLGYSEQESPRVTSELVATAAGKEYLVSREYTMKFGIPKINLPIYTYWHRLHYNHRDRSVFKTRDCQGEVTGWTGGWTIEKNEQRSSHYARGGLGFCDTKWKWKFAGSGNWSLNSSTRWAVDHEATVVMRESTAATP